MSLEAEIMWRSHLNAAASCEERVLDLLDAGMAPDQSQIVALRNEADYHRDRAERWNTICRHR